MTTGISGLQLIQPVFVVPGRAVRRPIPSLEGMHYLSSDLLVDEILALDGSGINEVILYGIPERKVETISEIADAHGLVQEAIFSIARAAPRMRVLADLCVCQYFTHGHCGVLRDGKLDNDETLDALVPIARSYAKAGAHGLVPSGMTDGVVGRLRHAVTCDGFPELRIISQSPKFASRLYVPFRKAASSEGRSDLEKDSYQVDPADREQALREISLDVAEGADMVMVKPTLGNLDIVRAAREQFSIPIAAFCTSGECALIRAGISRAGMGYREMASAYARAGATSLVAYFAKTLASQRYES